MGINRKYMNVSPGAFIRVFGIGNQLMSDDGIGVIVARRLMEQGLAFAEIIDAGTPGYSLIDMMAPADRVVFIDAIYAGREPGSVFWVDPERVMQPHSRQSLHQISLSDVLSLLKVAGSRTDVRIIGIQPERTDPAESISSALNSRLGAITDEVGAMIRQLVGAGKAASAEIIKRFYIEINGIVQGVGFRPYVSRTAAELGLSGWARNQAGLALEIEGKGEACDVFINQLRTEPPPAAEIFEINVKERPPLADGSLFQILESVPDTGQRFVRSDIGICDDCRAELLDSSNRRFSYPFINCTQCGPRFTIVKKLPYDREYTSMHAFGLCSKCAAEYEDRRDRRFHAEPNACPDCGPEYSYCCGDKYVRGNDAVDSAADDLKAGKIVAIKGIGGWHLCCSATDSEAVAKIRQLKPRPDKPMAVMVPDAVSAAEIADVSDPEEAMLSAADRPIVLLRAKKSGLAANVAGGLNTIGIMLAYAPVHVQLFQKIKTPLVMTSANRSGAPIVTDNDKVAEETAHITDSRLRHDRQIVNGCDDTVARRAAGRTLLIRSGRGRAPTSLALPGDYKPIMACGADLKSSITLAADGWAHMSQYFGDLSDADCFALYRQSAERFSELLGIKPEIIAGDMHPDYVATAFGAGRGLPMRQVQHHHAHIVAAMAEAGLNDRVIGVAFDGSGWGEDGNIWGGEWFICDRIRSVRAAHFKYVAMPGGEAAIREPWRMALSYLRDADASFKATRELPGIERRHVDLVARQIDERINVPLTSSAGRLFDAAAALITNIRRQSYEGQAAAELESMADEKETGMYTIDCDDRGGVVRIDPAGIIAAVAADRKAGIPSSRIAARFHNTLAESICLVCEGLRNKEAIETVVLAGGVFVNGYLMNRAIEKLENMGFEVIAGGRVPINDGGISFGQAAIVAAGGGYPLESEAGRREIA